MKPILSASLQPGRPHPLGSSLRDGGVNFAVFSENAEAVELCVFDTGGARELRRYPLHGPDDGIFHGFLPAVGAGLVYGYRAHGPYAPAQGHRFNAHKLLLDPCAREIVGRFQWYDEHHGYELGHPEGARSFDSRDNALQALKSRVAPAPSAALRPPRPRHARNEQVLYELHVKGFSMRLPGIPPELRGRYAGLAHAAAIAHFQRLGITTLCLLPVHYSLPEQNLARLGLSNYWGYNTIGYFCPDPRFGSRPDDPTAVAEEFRTMVDAVHAAGLEVVLDVVYNHTAEGSEVGPTLSFRGLDNASWYWLMADDHSRCENWSHCGNTLNVAHPRVTQFVLDSLRYWVEVMGVDGFRFDLAPVLGRHRHGFDPNAAFFVALRQDPVLAEVHLISEPWDGGPDGYQVGRFPGRFMDWNDRFRDSVRNYWLQRGVTRGEFARRFTASSDLFHHGMRAPTASINFISAHDGFTLRDLVSYAHKHNEANGEQGRDGRDHEPSANFGCEGSTGDAAISAQRLRVSRALLATLLLAQGTPMLLAGDESGNSQGGNNNAYCQDNPTGWLDWPSDGGGLSGFVARLIRLRRSEPLLHHDRWFETDAPAGAPRLHWLTPAGQAMQVHDWHDRDQHAFACRLDAGGGSALLLLFNPESTTQRFAFAGWMAECLLDSSGDHADRADRSTHHFDAPAQSLIVLRARPLHEITT